jgi:hypothetical protein
MMLHGVVMVTCLVSKDKMVFSSAEFEVLLPRAWPA